MTYEITDEVGDLPTMTEERFESLAGEFVELEFSKMPEQNRVYVYFKNAAELKAEYYNAFRNYIGARVVILPRELADLAPK